MGAGAGRPAPTQVADDHDARPMTAAGMILGTAAYMSPRGRPRAVRLTKRSDVWSFGCVPVRDALPGGTRPSMEKTSATRLRGSAQRKSRLGRPAGGRSRPSHPCASSKACPQEGSQTTHRWTCRRRSFVLNQPPATWLVAPAVVGPPGRSLSGDRAIPVVFAATRGRCNSAGTVEWLPSGLGHSAPLAVTRFPFTPAERTGVLRPSRSSHDCLSVGGRRPDGVRGEHQTVSPVDVRAGMWHAIQGTERYRYVTDPCPFHRMADRWLFYAAGDQTLKRNCHHGRCKAVTALPGRLPRSAITWGPDGIVFGQRDKGIHAGFFPEMAGHRTCSPPVKGRYEEGSWPRSLLPGGQHVLYTLANWHGPPIRWEKGRIVVQSIPSGEPRNAHRQGGSRCPVCSKTGHLVYACWWQPCSPSSFDLQRPPAERRSRTDGRRCQAIFRQRDWSSSLRLVQQRLSHLPSLPGVDIVASSGKSP